MRKGAFFMADQYESDDDDILNLYKTSGQFNKRAFVWDKSDGRCWYCGKDMHPFLDFTIDHVQPQKDGGDDALDNLVPCCRSCNLSKKTSNLEDFRLRMMRHAGRDFSPEQIEYLGKYGIILPTPEPYVFWYESQGLI